VTESPVVSVAFGPFTLFPSERKLLKNGTATPLGGRAMDLLIALTTDAGTVLDKQELLARVWPSIHVDESNLRAHIASLRRALGDDKDGARYIMNVAGRGYSFVAPVTRVTKEASTPRNLDRAAELPGHSSRMIDREEDTNAIATLLTERRFVTVHGAGGVGKTTVALAVARALANDFTDGVRFIDLGLMRPGDSVADAVASALRLVIQTTDPTPNILSHLHGRRLLIVLDCCEHVVSSAAALAESIWREAQGVSLLATSREPLLVEGEHVYTLPPLGLPPETPPATVDELLKYPAAQLFHERAIASGHRRALDDDDVPVVAHICRKVEGIALALELAGGRVGTHGLQVTASLLDGHFNLLWRGRRTAPPRHQTLNATLDWSFALIDAAERDLLQRLSIFVGAFTIEECLAIATAGDGADHNAIIDSLGQLVAKSLLLTDTSDVTTRYRLLDTTRAYARSKLMATPDAALAARRHALFYRDALAPFAAGAPVPPGGAPDSPLRYLANIRAALHWAFSPDGDTALGVELAAGAAPLLLDLQLMRETREWSERALSALDYDKRGSRYEMVLSASLGHASQLTSGHVEARIALERALQIARSLGDQTYEFRLWNILHIFYRRMALFGELLPIANDARAIADAVGDPRLLAMTDVMMGPSYHLVGRQKEARAVFEAQLASNDERPAVPSFLGPRAEALFVMARILWLQGFADQGAETLRLAEQAGQPGPMSTCQSLMLGVGFHAFVRNWTTVETNMDRLVRLTRQHGLSPFEYAGLGFKALALIQRGEIDAGIAQLRVCIAWLQGQGFLLHIAWFNAALAEALAERGHLDQALALVGEQVAAVERNGGAYNMPELLRTQGVLLMRAGDAARAAQCFEASMSLAEEQTALAWRLRTATSFARLRLLQGRADEARDILAKPYSRFTEGFATPDLTDARLLLSNLGE
jgi:predicted ATPase/DNA-binding winged helix-turn-helix (wHTH) protein